MTQEVQPQATTEVSAVAHIQGSMPDTEAHVNEMVALAEAEGAYGEPSALDAALMELYAQEEEQEEAAHAEADEEYEQEAEYEEGEDEEGEEVDEWQQRALDAEAKLFTNSVYQHVGGEEQYRQLTAWAEKNLTPQQQEMYDHVMTTGSLEQVMFTVQGLQAMAGAHIQQAPRGMQEGNFLQGKPAALGGFANESEAFAAIENPLYHEGSARGEAYRKEVERKMALSGDLGWNYR